MSTYTKQDVVNLVNALPESRFENCEGISILAPTTLDKVVRRMSIGIVVLALGALTVAVVIDTGVLAYATVKDIAAKMKERKAQKDAAIHKTLDEGKPGETNS